MRRLGRIYAFGDFRLDASRRILTRTGSCEAVPLPTLAFDTLQFLVEHAGEVVERSALLEAVWPHVKVVENSVNQTVLALRRALADDPGAPRYVSTVAGRGYRFIATVATLDQPTGNSEAYQQYVAGWSIMSRPGGGALHGAIACFERAVAIDPDFALAYVYMADCYLVECSHGPRRAAEVLAPARGAILRALELAPDLADAHATFAHFQRVADRDTAGCLRSLEHAISLDPQCFGAHRGMGLHFLFRGEFDAAVEAFRRAQAIQPMAVNISGNIGMTYYYAGRYYDAIRQLELTLRMDEQFQVARGFLGRCFVQLGEFDRAIEQFQNGPRTVHGAAADIPVAHALSGRVDEARAALVPLLQSGSGDDVAAAEIAAIYSALGEDDQALTWLERTVEQHRPGFFSVDPVHRRLHAQPRFQRLLESLGLR